MRKAVSAMLVLLAVSQACAGDRGHPPPPGNGAAGSPGSGPSPGSAGAAVSDAAGGASGSTGGASAGADAAITRDLPPSRDEPAPAPSHDGPPKPADAPAGPVAADARPEAAAGETGGGSQGPTAEGRLVFSQDFERDMAGFTPSPPSIPADRYQRVDDPVGQRGKVVQIVWRAGDNYRTSANNKPRSCISNRVGYQFPYGSKVSYAWGFMITSLDINSTFAQHIRPGGPMWMLEGHDDGDLIVRCGGTTPLTKRLVPMRWYDFRVEVDYRANGYVQVFIDGEKVYERRDNLGFSPPKTGAAHWDAGIYNTELGISRNRTRTVYISNLSIAVK